MARADSKSTTAKGDTVHKRNGVSRTTVLRGIGAGLGGTAAMTAVQELVGKLQSADDEPNGSLAQRTEDPWEQASAPAKVARRIIEGLSGRDVPPAWIPVLTNGMHWAYGTGWGVAYGLMQEAFGPRRRVPSGLAFGTGVWAMSYLTCTTEADFR